MNATFHAQWTTEFCKELIDIALSPYHRKHPNKHRCSSRTTWTKLNILLVGEEYGNPENGHKGNEEQRVDIHSLTKMIRALYQEQVQKVQVQRQQEQQPAEAREHAEDEDTHIMMKIECLAYPCTAKQAPASNTKKTNGSTSTTFSRKANKMALFHSKMSTKLGSIVLDGGLGLFVQCPPTITTSNTWKDSQMLQYMHDITKLLHSTILPHMMFRNSGAVLHLNSVWVKSTKAEEEEFVADCQCKKKNTKATAIIRILYNSVQAFQNQLIRSIYYEYRTHGIDCLSMQYDMTCNDTERGETDSDEQRFEVSPREILHQSLLLFGKQAEAKVVS